MQSSAFFQLARVYHIPPHGLPPMFPNLHNLFLVSFQRACFLIFAHFSD